MTNTSPLLSIVVTSRNDDHGGELLRRMQLFVTGLLEQTNRHQLNAELVIVEWNPPLDRPQLAQALKWPDKIGPCAVRIIEVPPEAHRRFEHSERLPLYQMIAKNVGIRRSLGRFILATNVDILFSNEIISFLASDQLKNGYLYRVDRYDVRRDIPDGVSIDEQLDYCHRNVIRIHGRNGTKVLESHDVTIRDLVTTAASPLVRLKRWFKGEILHGNACGDFTLMAREYWLTVRGYPEFRMYSFLLDGIVCYAAYYAGAKETILRDPLRIYHIEHSLGSGWTPGLGSELLRTRLAEVGIPQLSRRQYSAWVKAMCHSGQPIIFNTDDNWGLANEKLAETVIA